MKDKVILTITSLLTILFLSFHRTDDLVRGFERGGVSTYWGVLILAVWLYATLLLAERRLVGGRITNSSGIYFWTWTLLALGVTACVSVILSVRGLWRLQSSRSGTGPL
jgi:hypothetical protein